MPFAFSPSSSLRSAAALLALAAALGGCSNLPHRYGQNVVLLPSGGLQEANPVDVVVAPVVVMDEGLAGDVPKDVLRASVQRFLPLRRYSPLAIDYVDERVVEASYQAGACDEQATMELRVHQWDDRHWDTRGTIDVVVEARFLDSAGDYSQPLWAGRLEQKMNAGARSQSLTNKALLMEAVCDEIARELFENLPARRVSPGRR